MEKKVSSGFHLLNDKIKRWIWDKGWQTLRDIQEASIKPILSADTDIIIASSTASGKTEAAYLPICSYLIEHQNPGIRVLYISPLKALIDDQYFRLEEISEYSGIHITRWHGDVSSSKKRKLLKIPKGILLITPESLEALFVLRGYQIEKLFSGLSFVIIDELHSFFDNERGKQLQSLLCRIETVINREVPRLGLSATIADMSIAARFLRPNNKKEIKLIRSNENKREVRLQIKGYVEKQGDSSRKKIAGDLFNILKGNSNLIFANTRGNVEAYTDVLRRMCEENRLPQEFFPHHGSLSKNIRKEAETRLKDNGLPANVICTSTLELGIDIGRVKSIAHIGCPVSISAMRQRLGRSGRKENDPSILRIFIEEEAVKESNIQDMIRAELYQAVAMVELLIQKWLEPPEEKAIHFSTFIQQMLSLIAQYGGIKAVDAYRILCVSGTFQKVDKKSFIKLLKNLGVKKLISQMNDGTLILDVIGERIVNHYSFYTVFVSLDEYRLIAEGKVLGTLPITNAVSPGIDIIFAGKRWLVVSVNAKQKVIELKAAVGGKPPRFSGVGMIVHNRIRKEMYNLYISDYVPTYLDKNAVNLFIEGREGFNQFDLEKKSVIVVGNSVVFFPWTGDRVRDTLYWLLMLENLEISKEGICICVRNISVEQLIKVFMKIMQKSYNPYEIAKLVKNKAAEKYDGYLSGELLCAEYAARNIDVLGAIECLKNLVDKIQ